LGRFIRSTIVFLVNSSKDQFKISLIMLVKQLYRKKIRYSLDTTLGSAQATMCCWSHGAWTWRLSLA